MHDIEALGVSATGESHAHLAHVIAAKHADRRFDDARARRAHRIAIQEAPHIRQEGHELAVVARLELAGRAAELIAHFAPGIVRAAFLEQFPVFLDLRASADRRELQRPQKDLPELADELGVLDSLIGHGFRPP
jgi:hypothetical protein